MLNLNVYATTTEVMFFLTYLMFPDLFISLVANTLPLQQHINVVFFTHTIMLQNVKQSNVNLEQQQQQQ